MKIKKEGVVSGPSTVELGKTARLQQERTLALLRQLVEVESPSGDKDGVDRCMQVAAAACGEAGGKVRWHRQKEHGDLLEVRFPAEGGATKSPTWPLLILGHLDTVWPLGTLAKMPFRTKSGRVFGPGVFDMKAGVAMALSALSILKGCGALTSSVILLLNSEEEIGSPVSRPITEAIARDCEAVFVLEPGQGPDGAYKTSRKGTGDYMVRVTGVAAHAGVDFKSGHSAVLELARQIGKIGSFTDREEGLTVNPGVIGGGTLPNVVAAEAWAHIDFRFAKASHAKKIERMFRELRPMNKNCKVEVVGGVNRPPMERTKGTAKLFAQAATLANELGFELQEATTGGGSDGNFTSAIGVPTLDGMGAVGEGAHASNESILIEHLAPRTALLAAMIAKVGGTDAESGGIRASGGLSAGDPGTDHRWPGRVLAEPRRR
jgi:glutamate carboxypeptidase